MKPRLPLFALCFLGLLSALWAAPAFCQAQTPPPQKPRLVVQIGHSNSVTSLAFSSDGSLLASGSVDRSIKIWNTIVRRQIRTLLGSVKSVTSVAFSPDGKTLASGGEDGTIRFWDVVSGMQTAKIEEIGSIKDNLVIRSLVYSADGKTLVSGDNLRGVKFWHLPITRDKEVSTPYSPTVASIQGIQFSPDKKTLAAAENSAVQLWDAATQQKIRTLPTGKISKIAFTSDGNSLVTAGSDAANNGVVTVWNLASGQSIWTFPQNYVEAVAVSPDGKHLVCGGLSGFQEWNLETGQAEAKLDNIEAECLAFSPAGILLAHSSGPDVCLWDMTTRQEVQIWHGQNGLVSAACVSPDGSLIADSTFETKLWDRGTGKLVRRLNGSYPIAFSPNGTLLATAGFGANSAVIWDAHTGEKRWTLVPAQKDKLLAVSFDPTGKRLYSIYASQTSEQSSKTGYVCLWDLETGKLDRILPFNSYVFGGTLSPDGKTLAVVTGEKGVSTVVLWSVAENRPLHRLLGQPLLIIAPGEIHPVAFSPNGRLIALGDDSSYPNSKVLVWDVQTGQQVLALSAPNVFAFSPDSQTLATVGANSSILLTGISGNGEALPTQTLPRILPGDVLGINSLNFSPDSKTILSGGSDMRVTFWDVAGGTEIASLIAGDWQDWQLSTGSIESAWDTGDGAMASLDWIVAAPDGRFDTNNLETGHDLVWVLPTAPLTPVPLEAFMRQYYTPNLLPRLLADEKLPNLPDITQINYVQPLVAIDSITPHPGGDPALVDVTVSYSTQQAEALQPDGTKKTNTSGVYDLHLFRDGQLVASLPEEVGLGAAPTDLSQGKVGQTFTHTFTGIRLGSGGTPSVSFTAYAYSFTAYAFNADKVKSQTASLDYTPPQPLPTIKGRAWVIAFGVNAYEDPHWNLHFAAADARSFGEQLVPRLQKTEEYSQVKFVPLVSDTGDPAPDTLPATKAALRAVLTVLAGQAPDAESATFASTLQALGVTKAAPEDMVLLAFSCHGDTDPKTGEYYLFPSDIGPNQSHGLTSDLETHSLSSAELTEWMQGVDAGEMAMVIDSCHSAAVAGQEFKPGPMDSPGLGQLAYYKRMRILSASAANAVAKEYPDLGHGLLTAALMQEGLIKGGAKPALGQSLLTVGPWLAFAETEVPRMDAHEVGLDLSKPKGNKGIELMDGETRNSEAGLQKPSLFDFHRLNVPDAGIAAIR